MSHEEDRVARRSASQDALNGSYAVPTRAGSVNSNAGHHPVPCFKPLRSIREHGHTFLDPAASADGMLRKTTETGNIGLFSIDTGRPTALRPRASLGDLRQPHRPFSRNSDRPPGHDDRKRLPSYRDSTSEIISMYGSDNQSSSKSVSGTLSPPWDDSGQRSYSMTTCGSKSYALSRNIDFRPAHDFQAGTQRPRSPYPYPTRLPRPGIRPSSPALTENGIVDYSRMVEINRIPQRTVHHPYKTLFPFKTTRDQPGSLSMRYGINQSTRSLSDDRDPARRFPPPMSRRPPLPNHLHPWGLRPRDRLESGSSGQSLRTVSMSSTSGSYGCAPPQIPRLQVPEKKPPIFYDYSEDFEDAVDLPPEFPIANPTPKRISKSFQPGLPDESCESGSESADEELGCVAGYLRRMTMIKSGEEQDGKDGVNELEDYRPVSQLYQEERPVQPSTYESAQEALTLRPVLPQVIHTVASSDVSTATLEDHQGAVEVRQTHGPDRVNNSTNHVLVSGDSTDESPFDLETSDLGMGKPLAKVACYNAESPNLLGRQHDNHDDFQGSEPRNAILEQRMELTELAMSAVCGPDLPSPASATLPYRYSNGHKDSRFYSLSSGLSDLASFVKYVDKHMQALDADDAEHYGTPASESVPEFSSDHWRHCQQPVQESHAPPRTSSLAHQRRNAGRKINAPAPVDELAQYQVVSTRSGPTLIPQPISPAKMLRVKNSIPQLMKALPPLPGYSPASESPFNPTIVPVEFEPFEFSRLTDARSTLIEPFRSEDHGEQVPGYCGRFISDHGVRRPKLKLKHATSVESSNVRHSRPGHLAQADIALSGRLEKIPLTTGRGYSDAPVKRRLPIKMSRPTLSSMASEDSCTVRRRRGFDKSITVSELASSHPVDLFSASKHLQIAVLNAGPCPSEQSNSSDQEYGTVLAMKAPSVTRDQGITITDDGRGVSLDTHLDALHLPEDKTEAPAQDEMQSFFSDSYVKPQRGLRKKLSNLKSRLIDPRHYQLVSTVNTLVFEDGLDKAIGNQPNTEAPAPDASRDLLAGMSPTRKRHTVTPTRTVRSRWEKIVKGVRYRLRIWNKNKHKDE